MSTLTSYTNATRPSASSNSGLCIFNTDTDAINVSDGTSWLAYNNDGINYGANDYSVALDGTDDRVEIGNITSLNSTSAYSISTWFKSSHTITSTIDFFASGNGYSAGLFFYLTSTGLDSGADAAYLRYTGSLTDGNWKHLVTVYNGSSFVLYINGSLVTTSTNGTVPSSLASTSGNGAVIGARVDNTRNFVGNMDDFAIFDAALTATEVSNIYNSAAYPESKLQHLYRFENNYNDTVGSNNGTAQGNPVLDNTTARPY